MGWKGATRSTSSGIDVATGDASAPATIIDGSVRLIKGMAVAAMSLDRVVLAAQSSLHILQVGHRLQVVWSYTGRVSAQVIQFQISRDRPN